MFHYIEKLVYNAGLELDKNAQLNCMRGSLILIQYVIKHAKKILFHTIIISNNPFELKLLL